MISAQLVKIFLFSLISLFATVSITNATGSDSNHRVLFSAAHIPSQWILRDSIPLSANHEIPLLLALKQRNVEELKNLFHRVSNPKHVDYGKFLSMEAVNSMVAPESSTVVQVRKWLESAGISADQMEFPTPDFLLIRDVKISTVEHLFRCEMRLFAHSETGELKIRVSGPYSIPASVSPLIDFIGGFNQFSNKFRSDSVDFNLKYQPKYNVTPEFMHKIYSIPPNAVGTNAQNSQSVIEFLGQYYSDEDLQAYFKQFSVPAQTVSNIVGPNNSTNPGGEAQLDIEVIMAVGVSIPTEFWSFSGLRNNSQPPSNDNQEPFLVWLLKIASTANAPWVQSVSYDDDESSQQLAYTSRCDVEFIKAGVRGISLLFAAGDDGIGGMRVREGNTSCPISQPAWPSTSVYVTAIGGTQMNDAVTKEIVSSAATGSRITTGGGASFYYPRSEAPWQTAAVEQYLNSPHANLPPAAVWNSAGRIYPDISSLADAFRIVLNGKTIYIGGTSASTPLIAGMIGLFNDQRLNAGKSTLGFLNYWIYQTWTEHPDAFNDVTQGNNACSADPKFCCGYSFSAVPGYDAVSGVGTPIFTELTKYL